MKYDEKVYGNLELLVNICVSEKMRTADLISIENLPAALEFFIFFVASPASFPFRAGLNWNAYPIN